MTYKKFLITLLIVNIMILFSLSFFVYAIDPYMYFRRNLSYKYYFSGDVTYLYNPGIARNFEYDCVIAGSSMLQNTNIDETNKLFNSTCVKLTESGTSAYDMKLNLDLAFSKKKLKNVFLTLDPFSFNFEKNESRLGKNFDYLYSNKIIDKGNYLLNKNVILDEIPKFLSKNYNNIPEVTMNEYQNWNDSVDFGKEYVLKEFEKYKNRKNQEDLITLDTGRVLENLNTNVLSLIETNPDTQFFIIIPPRSILNWYVEDVTGNLENVFLFYDLTFERLLYYDNVSVYFFADDKAVIENLDNFKDLGHYRAEINSEMMKSIRVRNKLVTKENYKSILKEFKDYLKEFDYQLYLEETI